MGDDVVLDAVVDSAADDAAIEQFILGAIGAEANDAIRPGTRHPRYFQKLIDGRRVDIRAISGSRHGLCLRRHSLRLGRESSVHTDKANAINNSIGTNRRINLTGSFSSLMTIS